MGYLIHPTCQIPGLSDIYDSVFGSGFVGRFVEVGAFDGMTYSNTWGLPTSGWGGIYIEAHPDFAEQCRKVHRDNVNIETFAFACGAKEGYADLTIYGECSTLKLSSWNRQWGMNDETPKIKVPVFTLDSLIKDRFDLLVVDVEEMEIEVLRGLTLENYKPKMVIIELHEGQGTRIDQKGWQTPWVDEYFKGYKKIYADSINTIYCYEVTE